MEPESKYLTAAEYLGYRLKVSGLTMLFICTDHPAGKEADH